jgi:hypothetical protein
MNQTLGRLERVDPRSVWQHEARDFTPWLLANIAMLGEVLGLELEPVQSEAAVGDFSVDILARDLGRDRIVVIENQLEPTDHVHLGQLITYAAGLDASVVIWVSRDFREEHRQALDWLNRGHENATEYFGVAIELLRIDGSNPAPSFRLIASPNAWGRASLTRADDVEVSGKRERYRDFFQSLIDELRDKHRFTQARVGQPQNWYAFSSGTSGFQYSMKFALGGQLCAELYIDVDDAETNARALQALEAQRADIEAAFGSPLVWERIDSRRACRVACYSKGSIEDADDQVEAHKAWAIEKLLRLKSVLGPRLPKVVAEISIGATIAP